MELITKNPGGAAAGLTTLNGTATCACKQEPAPGLPSMIVVHIWLGFWFLGITLPALRGVKLKRPRLRMKFGALKFWARKKPPSGASTTISSYYSHSQPPTMKNGTKGWFFLL